MLEQITGLKVADLLGVFYEENGHLMVADEFEGARNVSEELAKFQDSEVRVLAHHRPPEPHDKERWGGGCCYLESAGKCHFGHRERPDSIYVFNGVGMLRREGDEWSLEKVDETPIKIHTEFLIAHRSQIIVATIPDLSQIDEKIKSFDPSTFEGAGLEELSSKLKEMSAYLAELDKLQKNINV